MVNQLPEEGALIDLPGALQGWQPVWLNGQDWVSYWPGWPQVTGGWLKLWSTINHGHWCLNLWSNSTNDRKTQLKSGLKIVHYITEYNRSEIKLFLKLLPLVHNPLIIFFDKMTMFKITEHLSATCDLQLQSFEKFTLFKQIFFQEGLIFFRSKFKLSFCISKLRCMFSFKDLPNMPCLMKLACNVRSI